MADSLIFLAFSMGIISACSLPLGTLTTLLWRPDDRSVGVLMAFGGGALLAALTIDLVGSALAKGEFYWLADRLRHRRRLVRRAGQHRQQPRGIPAQVLDRRALPAAPAQATLQEGAWRLSSGLTRFATCLKRTSKISPRLPFTGSSRKAPRSTAPATPPTSSMSSRRERCRSRTLVPNDTHPSYTGAERPPVNTPSLPAPRTRTMRWPPSICHVWMLPREEFHRILGISAALAASTIENRRRRHRHRISEGPPGPDLGANCRVAHECPSRPGRGNHPQRGRNRTPSRRVRTDIGRHTPPSHLSRPRAA